MAVNKIIFLNKTILMVSMVNRRANILQMLLY